MQQSFRQIKNRIRIIENTKKVTSAMGLISLVKLNRISKILYPYRSYCRNLESILKNVACSQVKITHPLFEQREKINRVLLCVVASDNGLCGVYNNNVLKKSEEFVNQIGKDRVDIILVGKKGLNYFKNKGINLIHKYIGLNGRYEDIISDEIANILMNVFLSKKADAVYVAYMHFQNVVAQKPILEKFFSIDAPAHDEVEYIFEPDHERFIASLLGAYIISKMRLIFLEAFTSEHASRSVSMRTATENAKELLEDLVLLRNKVRQASITQDIMEIISSSEALR